MKITVANLIGLLCLSSVTGLEHAIGDIFLNAQRVDSCSGKPDGYFASDVSACDAYFSCKNGTGVPLRCPVGLYFDEALQACNYPEQVVCVSCPPEGIATQPDPFNCTRFTLCYGGVKVPMECAPGLRFDPTIGQCGLAADVPCPIRCPPGMQAPEDMVVIPSDDDCAGYVICFNGTAVEFQCPVNTHFNRETKKCDTVENANCLLTTTTTPAPTTTATSAVVPRHPRSLRSNDSEIACPAEGVVFLPNPTDCSLYYICNEGEPISKRCAATLVFDLMSNNCNFPAQSVCVLDHNKSAGVKPDDHNDVKKPDYGPTAATPSKTAATPSGAAPTRWY